MYRFHFFCLDPIFFHSSTFVVRVRFVYFLSLAVVVKPVGRLVIKFHFDNQSIFCTRSRFALYFWYAVSAICLKGASTPLDSRAEVWKNSRPCCLANSCPSSVPIAILPTSRKSILFATTIPVKRRCGDTACSSVSHFCIDTNESRLPTS